MPPRVAAHDAPPTRACRPGSYVLAATCATPPPPPPATVLLLTFTLQSNSQKKKKKMKPITGPHTLTFLIEVDLESHPYNCCPFLAPSPRPHPRGATTKQKLGKTPQFRGTSAGPRQQ